MAAHAGERLAKLLNDVLYASAISVSHTGTTAQTLLATIPVPGRRLGANGLLRIDAIFSTPGANSNAKNIAITYGGPIAGGTQGTTYLYLFNAQINNGGTNATHRGIWTMRNRGSESSQLFMPNSMPIDFQSRSSSAVGTAAVDTSVDQTIRIYATLANAADTVTLESIVVEVLRP